MITQEILNNIYIKNLNGEEITNQELTNYGLNDNDVNTLINNNIIQKINKDTYGLPLFEDLYNYGIYLIKKEKFLQATNIFLKCNQLNPEHIETYEYLFYLSIRKKESKRVLVILDKLKKYTPNNLYNVYLYLVSYKIQTISENLSKKIKNMKFEDLMLIQNETKKEELIDELNTALEAIGNVDENNNLSVSQKLIIKELIRQCKNKENKFNNQILRLVEQENYQKIINILTTRGQQFNLNMYYKTILLLSKKIVGMLEKNEVPILANTASKNILSAIHNNNLDQAITENLKYLQENNIDKNKDAQYILLMRIKELIPLIINKKQISKIYSDFTYTKEIENILTNLFQNNIDKATELIKEYLSQINKSEYEYLILNLIHIDLERKTRSYPKTSSVLLELSNNEYEHNITLYIQEFYNSIKKNDISIAKIYLNIIKKYSQESQTIINSLEEYLIINETQYNEKSNQIKLFLLNLLKEMKENNQLISVLEEISYIDRKIYYQEIKQIPELIAISIGKEPKKTIIRKVDLEKQEQPIVYFEIAKQYKKEYNERNYDKCLSIAGDLLQDRSYAGYHAEIYAYIGLSYYHMNNYQESIKYLKIAEELSENSKNKKVFNFEELIGRINQKLKNTSQEISKQERKPFVQIKEKEFYDLDNNFGITNLDEIYYYIEENKMSIESACQIYSLTSEQILLVKLIYARNFYSESMYSQGDRLVSEVEKSKNKTDRVKKLLIEIRKNKQFYKNRTNIRIRKINI